MEQATTAASVMISPRRVPESATDEAQVDGARNRGIQCAGFKFHCPIRPVVLSEGESKDPMAIHDSDNRGGCWCSPPKEPRGARVIEKLLGVFDSEKPLRERSRFCAQHDRSISFSAGASKSCGNDLRSHHRF